MNVLLLQGAAPAANRLDTVYDLALAGGWLMVPIGLCSIVAHGLSLNAAANGRATASEDRTEAPGPAVGMAQQILWIQPYGSGRRPYWIPRSSSRRRMVTGPG